MIDVLFRRDGGRRPEAIVTDTGSYSDVVFGLVHLLGMQYRPALADLPDQKGWRIQDADYGPLYRFARGRIDLTRSPGTGATFCAWWCRSTPGRSARTT